LQHRGADRAQDHGCMVAGDHARAAATHPGGRSARRRFRQRPWHGQQRGRGIGGDPGARAMNAILGWLFDLAARLTRTLDWWLCGALAALMAIGLAVLYSAGGESPQLVLAQGARYA